MVVLSNVLMLTNSLGNVSTCDVESSSVHLKMSVWSSTGSCAGTDCPTLLLFTFLCIPHLKEHKKCLQEQLHLVTMSLGGN